MLRSLKPSLSHEDLFLERYERLLNRALQLTERNRQEAEDLLHDAFIHFTLVRPELTVINNLDSYLLTILRNLHLSHIRRAARSAHGPRSLVDFDSLQIGLRADDIRTQLQIHDELRLICHYACVRKETSKSGSVLLLRFFHGYYPSEVAQILRTPRQTVDNWVQLARREAKAYLNDPRGLAFMAQHPSVNERPQSTANAADAFEECASLILKSRTGECYSREQLENLYRHAEPDLIDCHTLAHLASCPLCLDEVNSLLGLPPLSERTLQNTLGRDERPNRDRGGRGPGGTSGGGGEGGSSGGSSGATTRDFASRGRKRSRETFEHRPDQLLFAANGFLLSSIKVDHERTEQTLNINLDEQLSFVEVFSDQGVRLLFMNVEPPPEGVAEQGSQVALSDGRELSLSLSFSDHWPSLRSVYVDPLLSETPATDTAHEQRPQVELLKKHQHVLPSRLLKTLDLLKLLREANLWVRPGTVTALFAIVLIGAAVLIYRHRDASSISAVELLKRSAAAEEAIAGNREQIVHRTLSLEVRKATEGSSLSNTGSVGELIARQKVEVWQSSEKGIKASRLYNERNDLIAGEWKRADGSRVVFNHGRKVQTPETANEPSSLSFDTAWQMIPAAKEFSSLVGQTGTARVQERPGSYVITYETGPGEASQSLVKATLVLTKPDLHAIEQTLLVRSQATDNGPLTTDHSNNRQSAIGNRQFREYRFVEINFERRASSTVAPAVFEPDPGLLGSDTEIGRHGDTENIPVSPRPPVPAPSVFATAALEVEVLQQLNQVNALLGEQINLTRTSEGLLRVQGVVETNERKVEILSALSSFKSNSAIRVDVVTVAEAVKRQKQSSPGAVDVTRIEVAKNSLAVEPELRAYLSKRGISNQQLEEEIRNFAERARRHSFEARRHALALKQIAERFSAEDLRTLDSQARANWRAMINQHARALAQQIANLRRELEPAFPSLGAGGQESVDTASDADLVRAAGRLFSLAVTNDEGVRRSFSLYAENPGTAPVKTPQFWRTLFSAESLSKKISSSQ